MKDFETTLQQHQQAFFNRLKKNQSKIQKWARKENIECYRIFDRDIPEIPLVLDIYGQCLHASVFRKKWEWEEKQWEHYVDAMLETALELLQIQRSKLFVKTREKQKGKNQYNLFSEQNKLFHVKEHGIVYEINLSDYLDTGLFLDHRNLRKIVQQEAQGKRFLNLFSYTGSISMAAISGGAQTSVTVDMSNTYTDWAIRNLQRNQFKGEGHQFIRADVFAFLNDHKRRNERPYQLAVIDPPTFSNSKKMEGVLDIQRDHVELINQVLSLMTEDGILYFSNNFRRFELEKEQIEAQQIIEISHQTVPFDFHDKKIHRTWKMSKRLSLL